MASVSKNVDIDNLDDIVNKYNNTYHGTIKVKPVEVKPIKSKTYFDPCKEINDKDPKIKIGDFVRISKYKNIFGNNSTPNWLQEVFVVKKVRNTVPYTNVINGLNGEEIVGKFYENELEKSNQKGFITVKKIKRKSDKLYVKRKGCNNSFNSHNQFHNILRLFTVLLNFPFTTSEMICDYYL